MSVCCWLFEHSREHGETFCAALYADTILPPTDKPVVMHPFRPLDENAANSPISSLLDDFLLHNGLVDEKRLMSTSTHTRARARAQPYTVCFAGFHCES